MCDGSSLLGTILQTFTALLIIPDGLPFLYIFAGDKNQLCPACNQRYVGDFILFVLRIKIDVEINSCDVQCNHPVILRCDGTSLRKTVFVI